MRLAYIGLGLMGSPMAKRLASLGYAVTGYDIDPSRVAAAGVQAAASAVEAAKGHELVLLNLPTTAAVEAVARELPIVPGQLVIDFSTSPPAKAIELGAARRWIDAPVSGGPPASATGELTIMAGGAPEDIERALPVLKDVSRRFTHLGPLGSGLAAKMVNQLIVGVGHAMMAEAIVLAESAGLDASKLPETLAGGVADSVLLQRFWPRMAKREFAPQGYVRQLLKDLEMLNEFAAASKAPLPLASQALSLYRLLAHLGHTELDTTALIKLYDRAPK